MVTITAPVHVAAGKQGSPSVHVLGSRSAIVATNGTIAAVYDTSFEVDNHLVGDGAFSPRAFKLAWADSEDQIEVELTNSAGLVKVTSQCDSVAKGFAQQSPVDLAPLVDCLSEPVVNATEVWLDAAQLAKLAKALGAGKGEPVKLTIPTTKGRGIGLVHVSRESAAEVRGAIMAHDYIMDPERGQSALQPVTIRLAPAKADGGGA